MSPTPIIAIVGRPNVGKSSLFNKIIGKRSAIVDNEPGVTRDRHFAEFNWNGKRALLVDTGGFVFNSKEPIPQQIREQAQFAIDEASEILFVLDGKEGLTEVDRRLASLLRKSQKRVLVAVNKIDHPFHELKTLEFHELGFDRLFPVSAEHSLGISDLLIDLFEKIDVPTEGEETENGGIRVSIVGRPNVGKSSLVNRLLGQDRMIVTDTPGTTRDSIDSFYIHNEKRYCLVDTAGIRRKSRVSQRLEKFCVIMALKSIDRSDIVLLLLDGTEGISDQDQKIGSLIFEAGKYCVIVVNKWDLAAPSGLRLKEFHELIGDKLKFLSYAPVLYVSAKTGYQMDQLLPTVERLVNEKFRKITTPEINAVLNRILKKNPPPVVKGKRLKIYYVTQVSGSPPTFLVFANQSKSVPASYRRFLINQFREQFDLIGAPVRLVFKGKEKDSPI